MLQSIYEFKTKATNTHSIIYKNPCTCTLSSHKTHDVKPTSNITLNGRTTIKANEYLLGCPICHNRNTTSTKEVATNPFIKLAYEIHGDKGYLYNLGSSNFICPAHGPQALGNLRNHLSSITPCTICDSNRLRARYISQANKSNKGLTNIYFVSFTSKTSSESFFKVGLCFGSLEDRFKDWLIHYDITPIVFSTGNAADIYDLEQKIHQRIKLKQLAYVPMNAYNLGGSSECFIADQECINKLKSYIINKTT